MKELTIEQKVRAYDEALKEASVVYKGEDKHFKATLERIFPELKESEDERIRKELTEAVTSIKKGESPWFVSDKETCDKVLDWLEKQGEQFDDNIITSSDERIRKAILEGLIDCRDAPDLGWSNFGGIEIDDCIDWLEKQGQTFTKKDVDDAYLKGVADTKNEIEKQYEANYQIRKDIATFLFNYNGDIKDRAKWMNYLGIKVSFVENQSEQKTIDKVGSQFKDGYWITNGDYTWKVISVDKFDYTLQNQWGEYIEDTIDYVNKAFHLWTIQDAKEGDVIVDAYGNICVYKKCNAFDWTSYFSLGCNGGFRGFTTIHENKKVCPATKELRELLSQKMKEAGYKWDAEKKELIKEKLR